jgi:uncharacterized protein
MSQTAKAQEPSMEEILASIRRIIADDDSGKTAKAPEQAEPKPAPSPPPRPAPPPPAANKQEEIDAMLADLDAPPKVALTPPEPLPPETAPSEPSAEPPSSDVLDLTESMATPPPGPAPSFRTIDGDSDVVFSDPAAEPPSAPTDVPDHGLISNATVAAVDSAFNSLAYTVLGQNARTLEDLVKEMLRPMLKGWLDDNLPSMVERIVRAEIERVSRGRP